MKRAQFASSFLCAAVLAGGASGVQVLAQLPANATVYASGLEGPRGLAFASDGSLYVAEAGLGGTTATSPSTCMQVPAPIGPYKGGASARISKVDTKGNVSTVSSGLPSAVDAQKDVLGVADVAFQNGELYALLAGGGCSHGNPGAPNAVLQINVTDGSWKTVANLSKALVQFPAKYTSSDDYEPDGSWYGLISTNSSLFAVEPNHGQIFSVASGNRVKQVIDISASQGHIVPTSLVEQQGVLYVGNLNLFPIDPQWAKVMTIAKDVVVPGQLPGFAETSGSASNYNVVSSIAGFTTIVSMKIGPDGLLYVLELSDAPGYPTPGAGKVVRVTNTGVIQDVVTGLVVPTGMTFGPDGALYVSNLGAAPQGTPGQILRIVVPAVP